MKKRLSYLWNHIEIATIILFFSLMVLVTFMTVITRYFFDFTFSWAEQASRIFFVIITFAGISWAATTGQHLKVTVLTQYMPQKISRIIIIFGDVVSVLFGVVMSYEIFQLVLLQLRTGQKFSAIPGLSVAVMYVPGSIFLLLFSIRVIQYSLIPAIKALRKGGDGQ